MVMRNKPLIWGGSVIVGVVTLIIIYFSMISLGIIQLYINRIVIGTENVEKIYDGLPLESSEWEILSGVLRTNHEIRVDFVGSQTSVGESSNEIAFTIVDAKGTDVTKRYDVTIQPGTLRVLEREITIRALSSDRIYNGKPLINKGFAITSGSLAPNHSIVPTITSSITNYGNLENVISATIVDHFNNDVTSNYDINYEKGILVVNKRQITIQTESVEKIYDGTPLTSNNWTIQSGTLAENHIIEAVMTSSLTSPGVTVNNISLVIKDGFNNDVTSNYDINYEKGMLTIYKDQITIQTESVEKIYDGTPLTSDGWTIQSGTLAENHVIEAVMTSSLTTPGVAVNNINLVIKDEFNNDVTSNYDINYEKGMLTVNKRQITIQTESVEKIYDGTPLTSNNWTIRRGTLAENHIIDVTNSGSIINAGNTLNIANAMVSDSNDNEVTNYYEIDFEFGILSIDKINLVLRSGSAVKVYDGDPLTKNEWSLIHGMVLNNHTLIVDVEGEITNIGTIENVLYAYVVDENDNNVTENYNFNYQLGRLTILSSTYSSSSISRTPVTPVDSVDLQIYATQKKNVYLRNQIFGDYLKGGWGTEIAFSNFTINPLHFSGLALLESGIITSDIQVKYLRDYIPFLTPYYVIESGENTPYYGTLESIYAFNHFSYEYSGPANIFLQNQTYVEQEQLYRDFVYEYYMQLPDTTRTSMLQLAEENNLDPTSSSIIMDVKTYIQNAATYNLNFAPIPEDIDDIAVYFLSVSKEGICQHFATAGVVMYRALGIPARYVTGYVGSTIANQWSDVKAEKAHAWVEVYIDGMGWVNVEVTGGGSGGTGGGSGDTDEDEETPPKPEIIVFPANLRMPYVEGGSPISALTALVLQFEKYENEGYSYTVTTSGELSTPGLGISMIDEIIIYDSNGEDVTSDFKITKRTGVLQLYVYEITVKTEGASKIYDGIELTNQHWSFIGELAEGHSFDLSQFVFAGKQLSVGSSKNNLRIAIVDDSGIDVTSLYLIHNDYGSLVVDPRPITILTGSAIKSFDGLPLVSNDYSIIAGSLAEGETLNVVLSGTQVSIGKSDNSIASISIMADLRSVINNYKIEYQIGELVITPAN